jgi:hypothetical protein
MGREPYTQQLILVPEIGQRDIREGYAEAMNVNLIYREPLLI